LTFVVPRRLSLNYREEWSDGNQGSFFRLESLNREDG
jgi:hypothetical protein